MKKFILYTVLFLTSGIGLSQEEEGFTSVSVLTNENYFIDPVSFLSGITPDNIQSGVLLDRELANEIILNVDGVENVTTINIEDWVDIYQNLRFANYDTLFIPNIDTFQNIVDLYRQHNRVYPIGIIDFAFEKIKQSALDNGYLVETNEGIMEETSTPESFSTHRAVASSVLSHHIYGDQVNFYVSEFFFFSNKLEENRTIQKVEIDFGNGEGFQSITMDEVVNVQYGSESGFISMGTKITYINEITGDLDVVISHSTIFRTGSSTVPLPDIISQGASAKRSGQADYELRHDFYPKNGVKYVWKYANVNGRLEWVLVPEIDKTITNIEYYILYAPQNTEKKLLRRPLIICDGFDVGNKRDFYENSPSFVDKLLDKEKDFRGLGQILNGDPSPWYAGQPSAKLIGKLQADGYDIVVINFLNGDGDIPTNAGVNGLRGFLNDVINSPSYRDNKTEEAVFVGPSMGGIISRYAFTNMEQAIPFEDPYVKMWISFDSPQQGANISIGVQESIRLLSGMGGNTQFHHDARESFKRGVSALNTKAAKQMLLDHETQTSGPHSDYTQLYNDLATLGFPVNSKNYAITNGGTSKLYPSSGANILDFRIIWPLSQNWAKAWSNENDNGTHTVMNGSTVNGYIYGTDTYHHIGYDNAPGGWTALAYPLSFNSGNMYKRTDDSEIRTTRTTFMVTTSAFGLPVTTHNVYNTWQDYTGLIDYDPDPSKTLTPFDAVYGMNGICEEHVRISKSTGDYLIDKILQTDFDKTQRPRNRLNATINQKVNGPVAYTAKEKYTFGGNGNTYTAQSDADIHIKAGEEIVWLPGFSNETGADITAEITHVDYATVFMKTNVPNTHPVDYTKPSPYYGQVFHYGAVSGIVEVNLRDAIYLYPNPVKNELRINLKGVASYANLELHIYSNTGKLVYSGKINAEQQVVVNVTTFAPGIYYCKLMSNQAELYKTEFIKIK